MGTVAFVLIVIVTTTISLYVQGLTGEDHRITSLPTYGPLTQVMYSGYIPTNTLPRKGSLFYWFMEVQNSTVPLSQVPIVVWVNGGPGCSAMIGNFEENIGAFDITDDLTLVDNPHTWTRVAHVLFVDQPMGTGFSYAEDEESYTVDQEQVSLDMYNVLHSFYELHPQYKDCPLYLSGESYAGKYTPWLAYRIVTTDSPSNHLKKVLKGIAVGNGFSAPILQRMIKGEQAYWSGLISKRQVEQLHGIESECIRWIQAGNTTEADSPCENIKNYLLLTSGIINIYDVRRFDPSTNKTRLELYLNQPNVREALHASLADSNGFRDKYVSCQHDTVYHHLAVDVLRDVRHLYPILSKSIKVLLYNGNFDLQDGPVGTEEYIRTLDLGDYKNAARDLWFVEDDVAGYSQCDGNFCYVSAFGSGHFYPHDQKRNARVMLEKWMASEPFCSPGQTIPIKFTTLTPSKFLKYLKDPATGQYKLPCQISQLVCTTVLNNCNGNGQCANGVCQCNAGYSGELCERSNTLVKSGQNSRDNLLKPQDWKYYTIELSKRDTDMNEIQVVLNWVNSAPQITPAAVQIGQGFGNNNPSQKICLYGKAGGLPTWNNFDFVVCEKASTQIHFVNTVDLKNKTSANVEVWGLGVFNTQPNPIKFSISYTQDYPFAFRSVPIVMNWKFWLICCFVMSIAAGLAIGASLYFRAQAAKKQQEFSRL